MCSGSEIALLLYHRIHSGIPSYPPPKNENLHPQSALPILPPLPISVPIFPSSTINAIATIANIDTIHLVPPLLLLLPNIPPISKPPPLLHPRKRRKKYCPKNTKQRSNQSPKCNNFGTTWPEKLHNFRTLI
ncbi:hypothetical protein OCU04_012146 [Sclerotinia nivalis]|uniref:Uncharacterized protein n=1 Tax=Sclerotinia nivalis TaxID=352851 RepID=A0A9X0AAM1_9HELO|nr:hypothetical protein OCU04_012146 [Sclerotinia nivalis]